MIPTEIHKQRKALLSFVLIALAFLSCGKEEMLEWKRVSTPERSTFKSLKNGTYIFHDGGRDYLANLDVQNAEVKIFDLKTASYQPSIQLNPNSLPHGIYPHYFIPHRLDSVFIFSSATYDTDVTHVYLFNDSGQILQTYDIKALFPGKQEYVIQPNSASPALYQNGHLFFQKMLKGPNSRTAESRKKAYSEPTELVIRIFEEPVTASNSLGFFPKEYFEANLRDIFIHRCLNDKDELIYSFPSLHDVVVFDLQGHAVRYDAHSEFIKEFTPSPENEVSNAELSMKYQREEPRYTAVYYDRYRDIYLRIAYHRNQMVKEDGTISNFTDKPKSIVVLGPAFERLGEIKLDASTFIGIHGITKEGILISEIEDDQLKFAIYEILLHR